MTRVWVGNDVIDLRDPESDGARLHPRFASRVLSSSELAAWRRRGGSTELLWAFFAAKEAAFKVASKICPGLVFAHRALGVDLDAGTVVVARSLVQASPGIGPLWLWLDFAEDRVEAIVSTHPVRPNSAHAAVSDSQSPSVACRRLLQTRLAAHLRCDADHVLVHRDAIAGSWDGFGPPRVTLRGQAIPLDISLSHHGRFVSASWSAV